MSAVAGSPCPQKNAKLFPILLLEKIFDHSQAKNISEWQMKKIVSMMLARFKVYSFPAPPTQHFSLASHRDVVPMATEIFCLQPENDRNLLSINIFMEAKT